MMRLKSMAMGAAAVALALGLAAAPAAAQVKPDGQTGPGVQGGAQVQGETGKTGKPGAGAGGESKGQAGMRTQEPAGGKAGAKAQGEAETETQVQRPTGRTPGERAGPSADVKTDDGTADRPKEAQREGTGDRQQDQARTRDRQGGGKAAARIEQQQVIQLRQYFTTNRVSVQPVQRSAVRVAVGVVVPTHVALYPLPATVVVGVPSDCPYHYFVWDDDIVIVDSCTRLVLTVIVDVV